ncbi:chordin-like protein 2 isoform X2 [Gigantopelta aegis]|uniref:chordin-like protein 2 isoform X2 n=1 Tax=Gigantopelta aegis TaxID=1735272 RepID=UPI001B88C191|nr:chordin-like protein 2 isoform X2 [Gigantopelta aegis]
MVHIAQYNGIMVLALLVVLTTTVIKSVQAGTECTLNDRQYAVGETWNPILQPFGTMPCVNCTCLQGGEVKCVNKRCPRPKCDLPKILPGTCCPTCEVGLETADVNATPSPGCKHDGKHYDDGVMFPSNNTGLRPTHSNQCIMCVCTGGRVLCHLKSCSPMKCRKYVNTTDDCCQRCEEEADYEDYLDYILQDTRPDNLSDSDCLSASGIRTNGTMWHPVIGPFGEMKCIICKCMNGEVECNRMQCVPDRKLPCKRPRLVKGACCKSCPARNRGRLRRRKKGRGCKGRQKDKRKRKRCQKLRKKNRITSGSQTTSAPPAAITTPLPPPRVTHAPDFFDNICLPKRSDRLVYTAEGKHFFIIGFDVTTGRRVELLKWSIRKGRLSEMLRESVPSAEFRQNVTKMQIIGASNKRNYKKFKRKLVKKLDRCKSNCRRKVILGTLRKLRLRKVKFGGKCKN